MTRIAMVMPLLGLCAACVEQQKLDRFHAQNASPEIGCPASQIQTSEIADGLTDAGTWNSTYWVKFSASGCDRDWACESRGNRGERTICVETPTSEARSVRRLVIDRLALETGCPREQVVVEDHSDWSRGGEVAYRMRACGKPFVCSSSPRHPTECKTALSTDAQ